MNSQLCLMLYWTGQTYYNKKVTVLIFSQYWDKITKYNSFKKYEKHNIIHMVIKGR